MAEAEYVDQRGENESASRRAMTSSQIRPISESAFHSICKPRTRSSSMANLLTPSEQPADDQADDEAPIAVAAG
jgi:hypothetical protein